MMITLFIDPRALLLVAMVILVAFGLYNKADYRVEKISDLAQSLTLIISLGVLALGLSRLEDISALGPLLSFVIMSNLYATVVKVGVKIYYRFS